MRAVWPCRSSLKSLSGLVASWAEHWTMTGGWGARTGYFTPKLFPLLALALLHCYMYALSSLFCPSSYFLSTIHFFILQTQPGKNFYWRRPRSLFITFECCYATAEYLPQNSILAWLCFKKFYYSGQWSRISLHVSLIRCHIVLLSIICSAQA